jgi:hypothetical protein
MKIPKLLALIACVALAGAACSTSTSTSKPQHAPLHRAPRVLRAGMRYDGVRLPKQWPAIPVTPGVRPTGKSHIIQDNVDSSGNWAGWAESYPPAPLAALSAPIIGATFTLPKLNCNGHGNAALALWVGFGGDPADGDGRLLTQDGIDAFCNAAGTASSYAAWDEDISLPPGASSYPSDMFPNMNYKTSGGIMPGDLIQVVMTQLTGAGVDLYAVKDLSTGNTLLLDARPIPKEWHQGFDDSTAEVIVEDPYNGNPGVNAFFPYPGYSPVSVTGAFSVVDEGEEFQPTHQWNYAGSNQDTLGEDPNGDNTNWTATPTPVVYSGDPATHTQFGGMFTVTPSDATNPITVVPPSTPTPTPTPTPTVTTPAPPADAVACWKATATSDLPSVFRACADDLADAPGVDGEAVFDLYITELDQLATIPLGGGLSEDTPLQQAQATRDIQQLDQFFNTPNVEPMGAGEVS